MNRRKSTKIIDHGSAFIGLIVVIIIVIILNLITAPERPVMRFILSSGQWEFTEQTAMNHFYGDKIGYKDRFCTIIPYTHYGRVISDGELLPDRFSLEFVDDINPEDTFPAGLIQIGYIKWHLPDNMKMKLVNKVGMVLTWDCGLRNVTQSFWYDLPLLEMREEDEKG